MMVVRATLTPSSCSRFLRPQAGTEATSSAHAVLLSAKQRPSNHLSVVAHLEDENAVQRDHSPRAPAVTVLRTGQGCRSW
jgi:hypothetical protein